MMRKYIFSDKNIILLALLVAVSVVITLPVQIYIFLALIYLLLVVSLGENFLISFIVISYLAIPGDISDTLRILINAYNILLLTYLFLRNYGSKYRNFPNIPGTVIYFVFFTLITMFFSVVSSASPHTGFIELARTIIFFIVVYFLFSLIKKNNTEELILNSILISSAFISVSLIYEFISTDKYLYILNALGYVTLGGYFTNSTAVGGFMAISIAVAIISLFKTERLYYKIIISSLLILQSSALLLTNARAAMLTALISTLFILYFLKRRLFKKISIALIIIVPLMFTLSYFNAAMDNYFRVGRILENTRYYLWDMSWGMIKDYPLLGVGPGMFNHYMYTYLPVSLGSWTEREIYVLQQIAAVPAHNFFLMRTSEEGILGLISAVWLFGIFFTIGFRTIKRAKNLHSDYYVLSVGIVGTGLGLLARSFFESTGIFTNGWITRDLPFWLFLGILVKIQSKVYGLMKNSDSSNTQNT